MHMSARPWHQLELAPAGVRCCDGHAWLAVLRVRIRVRSRFVVGDRGRCCSWPCAAAGLPSAFRASKRQRNETRTMTTRNASEHKTRGRMRGKQDTCRLATSTSTCMRNSSRSQEPHTSARISQIRAFTHRSVKRRDGPADKSLPAPLAY